MSNAFKCVECAHCVTATAPDRTLIRECHRYPPVATFINTPQGAGPVTFFPIVKPDWSCAEFAPMLKVLTN